MVATRAALARDRQHLVARGRRDHARPERRGERDGGAADAGAGAPHEHPLARAAGVPASSACARPSRTRAGRPQPRRSSAARASGGGCARARRSSRRACPARARRALRSARTATAGRAGRPRSRRRRGRVDDDLRAGLRALGAGPERLHDAGAVGAERVRLGPRRLAQADPDVDVVERARAHAHAAPRPARARAPARRDPRARPRGRPPRGSARRAPDGSYSRLDPYPSPMQDELAADGLLLGVARAEPYAETERLIAERRARGLFGDLRFTLTQHAALVPSRAPRARGAQRDRGRDAALAARPAPRPDGPAGRMPRYAWSDPYAPLRERLHRRAPTACARAARAAAVFVDSNHHVDRDAAVRAGLAFSGKNTMAIVPGEGSFVALGAIVTDAELEPAARARAARLRLLHALPRRLPDGRAGRARRARRDALPVDDDAGARAGARADHADALEDRVYGCDICQDVCPWNAGPARRRADLPEDPGAWVVAGRLARAAGRGAAGAPRAPLRARARSALPAPQRARRARQRAGRGSASWRGPTPTSADPLLRDAARRALDDG